MIYLTIKPSEATQFDTSTEARKAAEAYATLKRHGPYRIAGFSSMFTGNGKYHALLYHQDCLYPEPRAGVIEDYTYESNQEGT